MTESSKLLVIHSGTYKTGSSAIQLYLWRARHRGMLARTGVSYPDTGRNTGIQHGNLSSELRQDRDFMPANGGWDDLVAEILAGEESTTVISSEHFASLGPEHMAMIGQKCRAAGIAVRWIHYLREQAGFYNAFYVERLVTLRPEFGDRINQPFEEFGTWSPIDLRVMRYAAYAESILAGIPEVDLQLRPFSRAHLLAGDVVADFCATAGITLEQDYVAETNVGTGWRTVETARRLTPLVGEAKMKRQVQGAVNPHSTRMRWMALVRKELVEATNEAGWNSESAIYLRPEMRARILAEHHEDNVRTGELAGFPWVEIVEAEKGKPYNIGSFDDIPGDELMTVTARVLRAAYRPPAEVSEMVRKGREQRALEVASHQAASQGGAGRRLLRSARNRMRPQP